MLEHAGTHIAGAPSSRAAAGETVAGDDTDSGEGELLDAVGAPSNRAAAGEALADDDNDRGEGEPLDAVESREMIAATAPVSVRAVPPRLVMGMVEPLN